MNTLRRLWQDEGGFVVSSETILITTVLVIGGIVGLTTFRDQLVQEFGDASLAVGSFNQSYSFGAVTVAGFVSAGSFFNDEADDCDGADPVGSEPACIDLGVGAGPEQ